MLCPLLLSLLLNEVAEEFSSPIFGVSGYWFANQGWIGPGGKDG
jgi:hypothetical protein